MTFGISGKRSIEVICNPNFFWTAFPANPLMNAAAAAASIGFLFLDSNPATNPDNPLIHP